MLSERPIGATTWCRGIGSLCSLMPPIFLRVSFALFIYAGVVGALAIPERGDSFAMKAGAVLVALAMIAMAGAVMADV